LDGAGPRPPPHNGTTTSVRLLPAPARWHGCRDQCTVSGAVADVFSARQRSARRTAAERSSGFAQGSPLIASAGAPGTPKSSKTCRGRNGPAEQSIWKRAPMPPPRPLVGVRRTAPATLPGSLDSGPEGSGLLDSGPARVTVERRPTRPGPQRFLTTSLVPAEMVR
jgi:hypothetical protein